MRGQICKGWEKREETEVEGRRDGGREKEREEEREREERFVEKNIERKIESNGSRIRFGWSKFIQKNSRYLK